MIKAITEKSWIELQKLKGRKLKSRLDWLNHTGYSEAFEDCGRLYYKLTIKIGRMIGEIVEVTTRRGETDVELEIKSKKTRYKSIRVKKSI